MMLIFGAEQGLQPRPKYFFEKCPDGDQKTS